MADSRERLILAARRLFHEQGFAATGVATILREAGVNSGSLYHHFPSKQALLEAVLDHYLEQLRPEVINPVEEETADPVERIFALIAGYRHAVMMTEFSFGCPIGNLALEVGGTPGSATDKIAQNFAAWRYVVEGWIAQAADSFATPVDEKALSALVLSVMEGAVMQARTAKSIDPFDETVCAFRGYFDLLRARGT